MKSKYTKKQNYFLSFVKNLWNLSHSESREKLLSHYLCWVSVAFVCWFWNVLKPRKTLQLFSCTAVEQDRSHQWSTRPAQSQPAVKNWFVLVDFEKWRRTYGRKTCVNIVITPDQDCGSTEWIKNTTRVASNCRNKIM